MTVLAWDGVTLAADKRATNAGTTHTVTKVARSGDVLLGIAGHLGRGMQIMRWFAAGGDPATYPKEGTAEEWATMIVIHRDGTIHKYEAGGGYPFIIEAGPYAIGSARDFAYMAMHLGHDARRAVELTCELSVDCGNGIDTLTFEDVPT